MLGKNLFEYAVIRVMPRVEREEFINVGVILYCARENFLRCTFEIDESRIKAFSNDLDIEVILSNVQAIEKICTGGVDSGPIGQLDIASRFRWLTATRSTVIQSSKVHPGFCKSAEETLQKLQQQLVL